MPTNPLVFAAVAGLTAGICLSSAALAQDRPEPVPVLQPEQVHAAQPKPDLVSVDFPGGTLADFVLAIRHAVAPADVNVVLRGGAESLLVPAVTLRNVATESAFEAVCPPDQANIVCVRNEGAPIFVIDAKPVVYTRAPNPEATHAIGRRVFGDADQPRPSVLRIYSVKDIVSGNIPLPAIMDAVKTTLAVQREEPQPELLFHEDSGVLIVRGTEAQHVVVDNLLKTLERDAEQTRVMAEREADMAQVTQERIRGMQAEIEQTQLDLDLKRAQIAELQQASQQGLISVEEFRQATVELKQAELRIRHMQAEMEAARQKYEALIARRPAPDNPPAPAAEGSSRFTPRHPDQVRALIEALVQTTRSGGQDRVVGFEMQDGRIVVRYAGSKEGVEHLAHVCKLIELLDQGD
ncbi:MAG: hypothetical protein DYG94_05790 [Leptolyngbya sp. PLA3]|nr:MAG: hypothetical protein EDM82_04330 [Cyanobacteria bacterium CYA]MCE7968243.1 hypothetical protein [Leptolyngbya sp. PL-A3]